jgi:hypothetical protein
VKSLLKPLCVIALLVCKLAQAALLPMPADIGPCPQHSMHSMTMADTQTHDQSMHHAPCCKLTCECLQTPAMAGPWVQPPVFVGAVRADAVLQAAWPVPVAGNFFRPPIR